MTPHRHSHFPSSVACLPTLLLSILIASSLSVLTSTSASSLPDTNTKKLTASEHLTSQIEWIEANGGYYSPKIDYRNLIPHDPSSPLGMFVNSAVDEEEVLMIIPHACLVTTGKDNDNNGNDDHYGETCDTVQNLAYQFTLGETSEYFPYVRYCFDERHDGDLPTTWSDEGKALIQKIIGNELFPGLGITEMTYENDCGDGGINEGEYSYTTSTLLQSAYHHVLRRSWDDIMIPVFDMINHRNGPYKNVDSNSAHTGNDIHVVALRDIHVNEQLYLSYNECTDCVDYAYTYVLPDILRDYGFVEQFPQRWNLFGNDLMFQLEERNVNSGSVSSGSSGSSGSGSSRSDLKLTWLGHDGPPKREQAMELLPYLHGHLYKLKNIPVIEMTNALSSNHESYTILQFHKALTTALEHVIYAMEDIRILEGEVRVGGSRTVPVTYGVGEQPLRSYDDLNDSNNDDDDEGENDYHVSFEEIMCTFDDEIQNYDMIQKIQSFYQEITFWYNDETDDICMRLDGHLESCQRNRAHYHETLVHYAASFIPRVQRVMFLGGGDNMILHEVLKYNSTLDLVVGLELDKGVCDGSFKYFESQPHFDNDKVEWWFGDAVKSLHMLPKEYLGTFDLIFVDLQTSIVAEIGIMETLAHYAHGDHGIIIRNEDGGFGTEQPFALHSVDLYSGDVPLFCHQGMTMGSNVVEFTTAPRTQHDISNLYYPSEQSGQSDLESNRFNMWYNYRKVDTFASPEFQRRIKEVQQTGMMLDSSIATSTTSSTGVLMVLDIESISSMEEISISTISTALEEAGITISTTMTFEDTNANANDSDYETTVFIAEEGYILTRVYPQQQYCAFDIMLWTDFSKIYKAEQGLVSPLGGSVSSSYRIVTGGVVGVNSDSDGDTTMHANVDDLDESNQQDYSSQTCSSGNDGSMDCKEETTDIIPPVRSKLETDDINVALNSTLSSLLSSSHDSNSIEILILCAQESKSCVVEDAMKSFSLGGKETKLTTIHACPDSESIYSCESKFRSYTRSMIVSKREVDAIIIDPDAPKQSGQILHKILDRAELRGQLMTDKFVVIGASNDSSSHSSSSWLRTLLERFRTDFVPYNPSFHSEVLFRTPGSDGESLRISAYSAGNPNFYGDLVQALAWIKEATGLSSDIRYVRDGMNNYVADFAPTKAFSHKDYDVSAAQTQRQSQKPLGRQSVIQYGAKGGIHNYTPLSISSGLQKVLTFMNVEESQINYFDIAAGKSCVVFAFWSGGSAFVLYDGNSHLDLNLFTKDQEEQVHKRFEDSFSKKIPSIKLELRDVQPRGTGRTVVFEDKLFFER